MNNYIKYPRTFHLPWSRSYTDDDRVLRDVNHFIGKEVVVTEKLDGENCNLYSNNVHARSINSANHPSRDWVKMLHGSIAHEIPKKWRICGENMFAKHSIYYKNLTSYFLLFSIWNEQNICLSWDETIQYAEMLGLKTVPVLYRGEFDEKAIKNCYTKQSVYGGIQEGYVVRLADRFHYNNFKYSCAKFVRKNHVQTDEHWLNNPIEPNGLSD